MKKYVKLLGAACACFASLFTCVPVVTLWQAGYLPTPMMVVVILALLFCSCTFAQWADELERDMSRQKLREQRQRRIEENRKNIVRVMKNGDKM